MLCFFRLAGAAAYADVQGVELPSMAEARLEAVRYVGRVIQSRPDFVWMGEEIRVEVTDYKHLVLFTVVVFGVDAHSEPRGKQF